MRATNHVHLSSTQRSKRRRQIYTSDNFCLHKLLYFVMSSPPPSFSGEAPELIASIQRHQSDLTQLQIPRLRSCTGPLSVQQNLAAELREDMDTFEERVQELNLCVDDQRGEKKRGELKKLVNEFWEELSGIRKDYRAALLFSKQTIDSQKKFQRHELLATSGTTEKTSSTEKLNPMNANDKVTEALRRTIGTMQGELERSVLATQMLDTSTASLRSTSSRHDSLTNLTGASKQLIAALEKSDWLDRMLILAAFFFFLLVVLLILKQRILDRGLRMAFWWTRFIPDLSTETVSTVEEKNTLSSMLVVPSTTVAELSSALAGSVASATIAISSTPSVFAAIQSTINDADSDFSSVDNAYSLAVTEDLVSAPTALAEHEPADEL